MKRLLIVLAAAVAIATPAAAGPLSFSSDSDFLAADFDKLGGANVRWGNGASNGDWEYSVVNGVDAPIGNGPLQHDWQPGGNSHACCDPVIAYDGDNLTLDAGLDNGVATGAIGGGANTILFRAKAGADQTADIFGIFLTYAGGVVDLGSLFGDGDAEYVGFVDPLLSQGFSISFADGALIDGGANPKGSSPLWQIKVGVTETTVSEPGVIGLFGLGLIGLAFAARRRA
ncbi:MAG: PEP-CTERM sorting domain-containing protein [Pseudomonadota bacterium]